MIDVERHEGIAAAPGVRHVAELAGAIASAATGVHQMAFAIEVAQLVVAAVGHHDL